MQAGQQASQTLVIGIIVFFLGDYFQWPEVYWVVITVLIALFFIIFWPRNRARNQINSCLQALDNLQRIIFIIYLKRDYIDQHYKYEKELYFACANAMNCLLEIRQNKTVSHKLINKLNVMYEIIVSLGSLRYRVKDHTTFEVCEKELLILTMAISTNINDFMKTKLSKPDLAKIDSSIKAFNKIYENTLQLVTNEPINFLIFIRGLKDFYRKFKTLSTDILKI